MVYAGEHQVGPPGKKTLSVQREINAVCGCTVDHMDVFVDLFVSERSSECDGMAVGALVKFWRDNEHVRERADCIAQRSDSWGPGTIIVRNQNDRSGCEMCVGHPYLEGVGESRGAPARWEAAIARGGI